MTSDELEARNRKYGTSTLHVLLLSSGNIAVFDHGYELIEIVSTVQELADIVFDNSLPVVTTPPARTRAVL